MNYNITTVLGTPIIRTIGDKDIKFKRLRLGDLAILTEALYAEELKTNQEANRMNIYELRGFLVFDPRGIMVTLQYAAKMENADMDTAILLDIGGDVVQLAAEIVGMNLVAPEAKDEPDNDRKE